MPTCHRIFPMLGWLTHFTCTYRNSRFKAIKDSLQDSKINLPSMPSISSFSVSSFTPDFITNRERSNSSLGKPLSNSSSTNLTHRARNAEKPIDPMTRQPYSSAKAAMSDSWDKSSIDHPHLTRAMEQLEGDVVILGGYRGARCPNPFTLIIRSNTLQGRF